MQDNQNNNISINWTSLIKLSECKIHRVTETQYSFTVEPLERGFGITLANSLRRVLLSSLSGTAVCAVVIEGVEHEYSAIDGIKEDTVDILLNLKSIVFKGLIGYDTKRLTLNIKKKGTVTAGMIDTKEGIHVVNSEHVICTATEDLNLKIDLILRTGKGYVDAISHGLNLNPDAIMLDSLFSPVRTCSFDIENSRIGAKAEYDKLTLNISTNGSIDPELALGLASKILQEQLQVFVCFKDVKEVEKPKETTLPFDKNLLRKVTDLELSVRSQNCLKNNNIVYLGDLVKSSDKKMLKMPNFGTKSCNEMINILKKLNLSFGMNVPEWPPRNIEELAKKYLDEN